jgi:hypothetical protein
MLVRQHFHRLGLAGQAEVAVDDYMAREIAGYRPNSIRAD